METVRRLLSADPGARIIMLTVAEDLDCVALCRPAAGARGYLHKDASRAELRATVTQALADPTWRLAPRRLRSAEMGAAPTLTAREIQVLEGMSHGRSNAEIGRERSSPRTPSNTYALYLDPAIDALGHLPDRLFLQPPPHTQRRSLERVTGRTGSLRHST
ncbi:hypothetical protein SNARM312S_06833 [Streptomyces narbonensis]